MKYIVSILVVLFSTQGFSQSIQSPDKRLKLSFNLSASGEPVYQLSFNGNTIINPSKLGLEFRVEPKFTSGFSISKIDSGEVDNSWNPVWGEVKTIRNNYRELVATLLQKETSRTVRIHFKLFNDGLGFRYEFPNQPKLTHFVVTNEKTEFNLTGDHKTFWIPGDFDTNEYKYYTTKLSETGPETVKPAEELIVHSSVINAVQTPLMMKSAYGIYINIHEAALVNYPAMILDVNRTTYSLTSHLASDGASNKAYLQTPFNTPWRTIVVSDKATDILASKMILNLNEPSTIQDVSWIKPMKFAGVWWELQVGKSTWNYADTSNTTLKSTHWNKLKPNGKHGATTENTKRYIDFAAKHGITGVLVEGWDIGWEDWFGLWKEESFDFVTPYPDYDVNEVMRYAASKGVKIIMHHETGGSVTNYERRLDEAIRFMKTNGYEAVKSGYVGPIIPRGEHHDGQWMINHYNRVAEKFAQNKIMLDVHEPVRPTGLHRTFPNWLACEAARGNEFKDNPVDHETILPFTRLMGGPMDYTPGIFQLKMSVNNPKNQSQLHSTLVKQMALYVTLYSPLQMVADLPENYEKHLDAFQFIEDVAVDWDDTKILEAEPGDYITTARKAKGKDEWYLGAITDENARIANANLSFLDAGKNYVVTLYLDGDKAHWKENPMEYQIQKFIVSNKSILKMKLAAGGGAAVSIKPASADDVKKLKKYSVR